MLRLAVVLLLLLLLSACGPRNFNYGATDRSLPQLVVRGDASVKAVPDQLKLRLGVVTQQAGADEALAENNRRMTLVLAQLKELGIAAGEMSTGQFRVRPEWSQPPRPTPANWQRGIIGYRVSNELLIETTRVDLAGKLLGLAQQAGANQIGGLQFALADPGEYRRQAIELATAQAIRKAETMAAAAGIKLGAVQSMSLNSPGQPPQAMFMAEARMAGSDAVPVAAGRVEVAAAVTMIYLLEIPADKDAE